MRSLWDVIEIVSTKHILVERNTRNLSPYCVLLNLLQGNHQQSFLSMIYRVGSQCVWDVLLSSCKHSHNVNKNLLSSCKLPLIVNLPPLCREPHPQGYLRSRDSWCPPRAPWSEPFLGTQRFCATLLTLFLRRSDHQPRRHQYVSPRFFNRRARILSHLCLPPWSLHFRNV